MLGHDSEELARLERQAALLATSTKAILEWAGLRPGMRVLDLGTGIGDVAFIAAQLVGPEGSVIGLDRSSAALAHARERATVAGLDNVRFVEGDLNDWRNDDDAFDAVVGRLILLYVNDPVATLRHSAGLVRRDGLVAFMEFDMPATRSIPTSPIFERARGWIVDGFARSSHDPALGSRLVTLLAEAGLTEPTGTGLQQYLPPGSPVGPALMAGIVRSLLPAIEATGVATAAEIDLPNLEARLRQEVTRNAAVFAPPTLVGAWAHVQ